MYGHIWSHLHKWFKKISVKKKKTSFHLWLLHLSALAYSLHPKTLFLKDSLAILLRKMWRQCRSSCLGHTCPNLSQTIVAKKPISTKGLVKVLTLLSRAEKKSNETPCMFLHFFFPPWGVLLGLKKPDSDLEWSQNTYKGFKPYQKIKMPQCHSEMLQCYYH